MDIRKFFNAKPGSAPASGVTKPSGAAPTKEPEAPGPAAASRPAAVAGAAAAPKPAPDEKSPAVAATAPKGRTPARGAGAAKAKAASESPAVAKAPTAAKPPAAKAPAKAASKSPAAAAKAPAKQPAAKAPAKAPAAKAPAKQPAAKAPAKRKQQVVESDGDDDSGDDDDWEEGDAAAMSDSDGSEFEVNLVSEDEDDLQTVSQVKKRQKQADEAKAVAAAARGGKKDGDESAEPPAKRKRSTPATGGRKKAAGSKLTGPLALLEGNAEAMAAVAAVDQATEALPGEDALTWSIMPETAFGDRAPDDPPNRGTKAAPQGHPDCLTGKTFVISGVLDSLRRHEAEDLIKRHGGKVTGNVSGRTSFLIVGMFAGRSKYYHAKEKGIKMIDEDGLFALVKAAPAPAGMQQAEQAAAQQQEVMEEEQQQQQPGAASAAAVKQEQPAAMAAAAGTQQDQPAAAATGPGVSGMAAKRFYGGGAKPAASGPAAGAAAAAAAAAPARRPPSADQQLWVEKWRPKSSAELVGNQTTVGTLKTWLRDWDRVHLQGGEPTVPSSARGKAGAASEMKKKAVLMSGPPGIGKTSSALIVCRELGYEPIEVNASDTRGKSDSSVLKGVGGKLANAVKELTTNTAISVDAQGRRKKLCLIMDEVDGMSAGDRGGVADLIQTIHKTRVPIIAICNDKYSQKLKSLRNHTLELDYRKPTVQQISKRMLDICAKEGLQMNQATMDALVQTASGGDIRLILGQLQMIRLRARALSYDQVKTGKMGTAKDLEISPFEAARRLLSFESEGLSLGDEIDLVFQDADLVPLLVQENYLNHRPKLAGNDADRLRIIAKAADGISAGDIASRSVRQYQNWNLMPFAAVMSSVYPATYMRGMRETFGLFPGETNFPRFTAWLGTNSSSGKQRRLLGELHTRMLSSGGIECDRTGLRLSYLPVLRNTLTRPLVKEGKDGIPTVLRLMRSYCVNREDIDFISDVTKFKTKANWGEDPMKGVETQVKSTFTREFNKQHIKPKTGFGMDDPSKKKGGGKGKKGGKAAAAADEDEEGLGEDGEGSKGIPAEEDEEEEEMDPVKLAQKLKSMKHKGMQVTLKDGTAGKTGAKAGGRGGGRGAAKAGGRGTGAGRGRGKK